jgi:hypothetical protein
MFDPLAMIIADHATRQQVLSARPEAPTQLPRRRRKTTRRLIVAALRRLADKIEPRCVNTAAPAA